ncbi:hypothetical protein HWI79_1732 [Cryptosporidium felis]|nr:hypothetical protein HWI79_1732 [Cryptosporidium felis]
MARERNKNMFDGESISQIQAFRDQRSLSQEDEEELDNVIEVLVNEKKVWEAAFNAAKLEIAEKDSEILSLKRQLNCGLRAESPLRESKPEFSLLKGPFEANTVDSNKAIVSCAKERLPNSFEKCALKELVNIAIDETQALEDEDTLISQLEAASGLEAAYRMIFRLLVELRLENQSQEHRIESLNDELSIAQEAIQNLHKTIQDSQNSSKLVSVAYASQIKSLQDDLLNACKDIDFWKKQYEELSGAASLEKKEVLPVEPNDQVLDLNEWCNLGSGVSTMLEVEVVPDSYWWFIAF